ncbi:MAG: substrate-binding domain-containing protein [Lachnospiraceae bacterium]|nr:substrate-binding domain-containing protein [Lachnospiraceae bacterium]
MPSNANFPDEVSLPPIISASASAASFSRASVSCSWSGLSMTSPLYPPLTAISIREGTFAESDFIAPGIYRRARELRISIPRELSVIGLDTILYTTKPVLRESVCRYHSRH